MESTANSHYPVLYLIRSVSITGSWTRVFNFKAIYTRSFAQHLSSRNTNKDTKNRMVFISSALAMWTINSKLQ